MFYWPENTCFFQVNLWPPYSVHVHGYTVSQCPVPLTRWTCFWPQNTCCFLSRNTLWYLRSVLSLHKLTQHFSVGMARMQVLYYIKSLFYKRWKAIMLQKVILFCYLKLNETMLWLNKVGLLTSSVVLLKGDSYTDCLSYLLLDVVVRILVPVLVSHSRLKIDQSTCNRTSVCCKSL